MTERIRPAEPDDAPFLAWAMLTAARSHIPRGWFDIALKRSESECLAFLAVDLIRHALPEGERLGMREAQITFLIGNDPAARAYANAGFGHAGDQCSDEFEAAVGAPGIRRYAKVL